MEFLGFQTNWQEIAPVTYPCRSVRRAWEAMLPNEDTRERKIAVSLYNLTTWGFALWSAPRTSVATAGSQAASW